MEALFVVPDVPEYEATEPRVSKEGPDGVLQPISSDYVIMPAEVELRHEEFQTGLCQSVKSSLFTIIEHKEVSKIPSCTVQTLPYGVAWVCLLFKMFPITVNILRRSFCCLKYVQHYC